MAEIINFLDSKGNKANPDKREENEKLATFVWTCGQCGNSTFQLVMNGSIRCAHCNLYSSNMRHFDSTAK